MDAGVNNYGLNSHHTSDATSSALVLEGYIVAVFRCVCKSLLIMSSGTTEKQESGEEGFWAWAPSGTVDAFMCAPLPHTHTQVAGGGMRGLVDHNVRVRMVPAPGRPSHLPCP